MEVCRIDIGQHAILTNRSYIVNLFFHKQLMIFAKHRSLIDFNRVLPSSSQAGSGLGYKRLSAINLSFRKAADHREIDVATNSGLSSEETLFIICNA